MRTDVWPEPKTASEIEVRFLQLPDAEDYTRVRQFKIDEKGAVVSRGDSFRRKSSSVNRTGIECTPSPIPHSANGSFSSKVEQQSGTSSDAEADESKKDVSPTTSTTYMIYVIGAPGTGKSTLISQFMTSDHRNPFANEIEDYENTVSVNIGGQESDLIFFEHDLRENDPWPRRDVNLYLLVYCIDSRLSFKKALNVVEKIRECPQTKDLPIVLAGNKIDLERKRAVTKAEAGSAALTYGFVHYEISVALNLEVDDLLVGLIAEIKESMNPRHPPVVTDKRKQSKGSSPSVPELHTDFHDAIRRYSQRKKKQMGVPTEVRSNKCMNFRPWSLIERFRNWRRGSPCLPI
ncbi:hypothetical protein AB6A40_004911 [Gnathostoma spinigerum]|uniref:Uncharacterized protein n=1 Tax=Gnathostoma spinigerum TaxID=75299 RepID=A0ABD6ENS8_9BILA